MSGEPVRQPSPTPDQRRGNLVALALATLAFAICFAVWGLIAPLAPLFRELYQLSATQVGILVAVPVLLGSVARVPMGMLTDRYGGRLAFSLLMLVLVAPAMLIGLTGSYWSLLALAFVLGLAGSSFAVGVPFVAAWYPAAQQGFALGVYGMGNIGQAIAGATAPTVARAAGWQYPFWMFVPALVAMAVAFWLFGRDAPGAVKKSGGLGERLAVFQRYPLSWVLALFYFVTFGGFVAISIYLPTLLVGEYNLTPADAGFRAAGFVVLATLARPLGGLLSDRWGGTPVLNAVFLAVAVAAVVLALEPGMVAITVAFLTIAFFVGLGNGAVFKLVAQYFPKQTGAVTGLVGAAGGLGGFFPPVLMGIVQDVTGSYAIGFMLLSEFALVCFFVNVLALQGRASLFGLSGEHAPADADRTPG